MNKVIDKGFRSCRFVSTIVKHPGTYGLTDSLNYFLYSAVDLMHLHSAESQVINSLLKTETITSGNQSKRQSLNEVKLDCDQCCSKAELKEGQGNKSYKSRVLKDRHAAKNDPPKCRDIWLTNIRATFTMCFNPMT